MSNFKIKYFLAAFFTALFLFKGPAIANADSADFEAADKKLLANLSWWKHEFKRDPNLTSVPTFSTGVPLQASVHSQFSIEEEPRNSSS